MIPIGTAIVPAANLPDDATAVPEWIHLLPRGEVRTADGRGPYTVPDAALMITTSMSGGKLVLDENHATDVAAPSGLPSPARGWIVALENRADGIWGKVAWTPEALRTGSWRHYRGISPVIMHSKDGRISAILRASLTNTPNIAGLTTLHSKGNDMNLRLSLTATLGLSADVDDDAIIEAVKALQAGKTVATHSSQTSIAMHAARNLATRATTYRKKLSDQGVMIDYGTAVRRVSEDASL